MKFLGGHGIRMCGSGIGTGLDLACNMSATTKHKITLLVKRTFIRFDSSHTLTPDITVLLDEFGQEPAGWKIAGHVDLNQDLPGTAVTSTNTDCRYLKLLRHEAGHFGWYSLEDNGETARLLDGKGVFQNLECSTCGFALDPEAAEGVLTLRGETNVAEDGYASFSDSFNCRRHIESSFKLDGLHSAFFDDFDG